MKERRSLAEGLNTATLDRSVEEAFVYHEKAKATPVAMVNEGREGKKTGTTLVPLTTRVRKDFSEALKKASLLRQLEGREPNTLQAILEEALEHWLRDNGYLG